MCKNRVFIPTINIKTTFWKSQGLYASQQKAVNQIWRKKDFGDPWASSCHSVSVGKHLLIPFHLRMLLPSLLFRLYSCVWLYLSLIFKQNVYPVKIFLMWSQLCLGPRYFHELCVLTRLLAFPHMFFLQRLHTRKEKNGEAAPPDPTHRAVPAHPRAAPALEIGLWVLA